MSDLDPRISVFYEPPNEIELGSLQGDAGELIRVLFSRLAEGRRTLLPARVERRTRWYGIAGSDRDGRLLTEEMASWLGPPLCDLVSVVETPGDAVDEKALVLAGSGVLLRTIVIAEWQGESRENVRTLVDLWTLTPERASDTPRPVGRVLRYFYEAIVAHDRDSATPDELRSDPLLSDVALLRRPPAVSEHLARAADALYIPPDAEREGSEVWRSIASAIEEAWPGLVAHPTQVRSVHGARCLALTELLAEHPRRGVIDSLRANWIDDALVAGVVASLEDARDQGPEEASIPADVSTVMGHYHDGDFELVLDAAELVTPDRGVATAAMHAALNLGDTLAAARAVAIVDRLEELERTTLLSQAVEHVFHAQLVERNQGTEIPEGWIDWLRGEWPDRPDLLDDWSSAWGTGALISEDASDLLAGELLDALHDDRRGRVRNGLPAFVRWLLEDGLRPSSIPLAVTIFQIMLGSDPGRAERRALELLGEILTAGCSVDEYRDVVGALREQLGRLGPREVDWLASTLDLHLLSAIPDVSVRNEFFADALGVAVSWDSRIGAIDSVVLSKLFNDAGLSFDAPATESSDVEAMRQVRAFQRVGIYSLSESAAQNAARWIRDEWHGVDVRLSHAHSNNSELEGLVSTSDVVLMQTSHAKHAATTAIERSIEKSCLVRVNGRGATSLFRGLLDWAKSDL